LGKDLLDKDISYHKLVEADANGDLLLFLRIRPEQSTPLWPIENRLRAKDEQSVLETTEDEQDTENPEMDDVDLEPLEPLAVITVKVSSYHIRLASDRFQKMFSGQSEEALRLHFDGYRHGRLEDFNSDALTLVLKVLHARIGDLPKWLGTRLLAQVAMVVDHFGCVGAVHYFAKALLLGFASKSPGWTITDDLH